MGYDKDFYLMYQDYLTEPNVRASHNWIFAIAKLNSNFQNVVDFGCGAFNEFSVYGKPQSYLGIDINAAPEANRKLVKADYRNAGNLTELIGHKSFHTAFVSLFSTEITAYKQENYKFYERVFKELSTINSGLVSGFYYANKKDINPLGETGGLLSYQTLENPEDISSSLFTEKRIILPVPSKMFGQDVFEVWKFFDRKI